MQPQLHPVVKNSVPFIQPEFPSDGFLIFADGAPDEKAYLGHMHFRGMDQFSDEALDAAFAEANHRWPEHTDSLCPVDAMSTGYDQAKMEVEMLRNPWPYAYRHAGYVMAAVNFGWKLKEVSLRPRVHSWRGSCAIDCFSYGSTVLDEDDLISTGEREAAETFAMYLLAGSLAEFRFEPSRMKWCNNEDLCDAEEFVADFADSCNTAYLEFLKARAARLVDRCWPGIELVAAALVQRRELTSQELDELLTRSSPGTAR